MRTNKIIVSAFILIVFGLVVSAVLHNASRSNIVTSNKDETYSLNLNSGSSYEAAKPVTLEFTVQDDKDAAYKDFDRSNPIPLMVTVIRKDRTNFQHVHPVFNQETGIFTVSQFVFPSSGEYRVFASFKVGDDEQGEGVTTVYQDVRVGDISQYSSQTIGGEQLTSSANGYDTIIVPYTNNSHNSNGTMFTAGQPSTVTVRISQNGQPVMNLDDFRGSVGRLTAFGPKLEFIGTNSVPIDTDKQSGLVLFNMNFPTAGSYKLFMEIQVNKVVTTFEYIVKVNPSPGNLNHYRPMQNMDYLGL